MNTEAIALLFQGFQLLVIVVAIAQFRIMILDRRKAAKEEELQGWREAFFQQVFAKDSDRPFRFEDLLEKYRLEAVGKADNPVPRNELTPEKLRVVLVELCRQRVCKHVGNDTYAAEVEDFGTMGQRMQEDMGAVLGAVVSPMLENKQLEVAIFNTVSEHDPKLAKTEVAYKIAHETGIEKDRVSGEISKLIAVGLLEEEDGKLFPGRQMAQSLNSLLGRT